MISIRETQPGRSYEITDDGKPDAKVVLAFVNAIEPGILTTESVLMTLIQRLGVLNQEVYSEENEKVIELFVQAMELLTQRSLRRYELGKGTLNVTAALSPTPSELLGQIQQARALLTEVHVLGSDEVKQLIEKRTGPWMVWGVDRFAKSSSTTSG